MNEQPLDHQSDETQPVPLSRIEGEHRQELDAPHAAMPVKGGRFAIKQPRFAVTPAKLHDAALFRWKLAVVAGLILAAGGFGIACMTYAPKYTAVATMRMESSARRLLLNSEDRNGTNEEEFRKTQSYMIKNRRVLDEVLKKDNVRALNTIRMLKEKALWIEKELQAGFIKDTSIFRVSLSGEDPEDIAILVNEVVSVFKTQFVFAAQAEKNGLYELVSAAADQAEKAIEEKKAAFTNLAKKLRTANSQTLTLRERMALEKFGLMDKELFNLDVDIRRTESLLSQLSAALKAQENEKPSPARINEVIDQFPVVQKLQFELNALNTRIEECKKIVLTTSPRLTQYQEELTALQENLQNVRIDLKPEAVLKIEVESRRHRINAQDQASEKLGLLRIQKKELLKDVVVLGDEAERIGTGIIELEEFRTQIAETEPILKELKTKKARLDFEKLNNSPTISAESTAIVPTVNQASFATTAGLYSVAGFFLGIFGISFLEARTCRVHNPTEVHRELGIETLGTVPALSKIHGKTYGRTLSTGSVPPTDLFTEAFNGLCATILCDDRLKSKSAIMLTSASENEGKTLLAAQLAIGFARAGRKTLLLDCDFRNSRCHELFSLPSGPGLSEVLRGEAELGEVLRPLPSSQAHLLSAGVSDLRVVQSLSNGGFASLLARLRADYDCIIIDSAPTLLVSDGLLIGKMVDGVILVVRSQISKAPNVFTAYEQLLALNIRILGAVVNGTKARSSNYYAR